MSKLDADFDRAVFFDDRRDNRKGQAAERLARNIDDYFGSPFFSAATFDNGPLEFRIRAVTIEELNGRGGPRVKPVVRFVGERRGLVLNRSNANAIASAFGKNLDNWVGQSIELTVATVHGPSGPCQSIRARPLPAATNAAEDADAEPF